jgi:pyridoxamine 5'-phosphate oxidase
MKLAELRQEYTKYGISKESLDDNPIEQFKTWIQPVLEHSGYEANAMTLSTVNKDNQPNARIVLLKEVTEDGFVFYTNYESRKGFEINQNPKVCLQFFWSQFERQVKVEGVAETVSREESEEYFKSRPLESQFGAWASRQSKPIANRAELEEAFKEAKEKYGENIPLPPFWGGYLVKPTAIEFWQGRPGRLHDRIEYTLKDGVWVKERLSP